MQKAELSLQFLPFGQCLYKDNGHPTDFSLHFLYLFHTPFSFPHHRDSHTSLHQNLKGFHLFLIPETILCKPVPDFPDSRSDFLKSPHRTDCSQIPASVHPFGKIQSGFDILLYFLLLSLTYPQCSQPPSHNNRLLKESSEKIQDRFRHLKFSNLLLLYPENVPQVPEANSLSVFRLSLFH